MSGAVPGAASASALPAAAGRERSRRLALRAVGIVASYAVLVALSAVFLLPFAFMVSTALKTDAQVFELPMSFVPRPVRLVNFATAVESIDFWRFALNTTIITVACLIGETLVSAIVAYGFARLEFAGRDGWFVVLLSTMMLPQQVTLIPLFILFKQIGWLDTFLPLIVPAVLGGAPFYVFLLRQFFLTVPRDYEDAARIDGASDWSILTRIFIPLSTPALASVVIFSVMFHWNDFFRPLIFLTTTNNKTLALALTLFKGQYTNAWNLMMAAATLVLLPCVLLFFLGQRYFVEGITMSGLKG